MIAPRGVVLDSSAVVAMLTTETLATRLVAALEAQLPRYMSAGTVLETSLVLQARHGSAADVLLHEFLHDFHIEIVDVDREQLRVARDAARRFGRSRHAAALNYGDCFAYALAMTKQAPLLFIGNDFTRTDITALAY